MTTRTAETRGKGEGLILFLDLDDVCVLNSPYGGYDAALALKASKDDPQPRESPVELWTQLVAPRAASLLKRIHDEFKPLYVLTTSWWWLMDDEALRDALQRAGLDFVVSNLHPDMSTPKGARPDLRWVEIKNWLTAC